MLEIKSAMIKVNSENKQCVGFENNNCNCSDPDLFENDHINPQEKEKKGFGLRHVALSKLHMELKKCVIRCIKCHRMKTKKEQELLKNEKGSNKQRKQKMELCNKIKREIGKCSNENCLETVVVGNENLFDFDHVKEKGIKLKPVSVLVHDNASDDVIKNEIAKCRLLCCYCHRKHTAQQFNYRKLNDFDPEIIKIAKEYLKTEHNSQIKLPDILTKCNYKYEDLYNRKLTTNIKE